MVLTIAACIGTLQRADAKDPVTDNVQATNVDTGFAAENNYHHDKIRCTQIDLVCNNFVIDRITCRPRSMAGDAIFQKTNNGPKKECDEIAWVKYVQMDEPCYKYPTECPSFVPLNGLDASPAINDGSEDDIDEFDENDADADMNAVNLDAESLQLHKKNHRNRHHHHKKPHPKHVSHPKREYHPWAGLCVAKGTFCGANLFGCDFISRAVYVCDHVGARPKFETVCTNQCKDGTCNNTPTTPPTDLCKTLVTTLLGLIETLLGVLDIVLGLLPPPLSALLLPLVLQLKAYIIVASKDAIEFAATLVSLRPIARLLRSLSVVIAAALGLPPNFLDALLGNLDNVINTAAQVIKCAGVPQNCYGLFAFVGHVLKAALILLRELLALLGPLGIPISLILIQVERIADNLIDGVPGAVAALQALLGPLSAAIVALPVGFLLPFEILTALMETLFGCI
ncbi:hypothetical protein BGZ51_009014 [Haplosporangium sp. Z 767]|nr:hypothetical protein BGZ51_009014 [Haplosporangium sp. Z 767]